ncbi:MAG: hypothetical protein SGBAC_001979 [Bacillariaceae sp.]
MLSTKLRQVATKPVKSITRNHGRELSAFLATQWNASTNRSISTETEDHFKGLGYLDDEGLTIFDTIHDMQVRSCEVYAENELFGSYDATENKFKYVTYDEFDRKVDTCRAVLKDLGVEEYGKVAIISNNRLEWAVIACAAYSLNASLVPMYEAQLPKDWTYILNDSGSCAVICATQEIYDCVQKEVLPSTPTVTASICLDAAEGEPHAFATLMAAQKDVSSIIVKPTPDDLANLIYTSGTTGQPKGVELTHLNFASNTKSASRSLVDDPRDFIRESDRSLAFLPWAHSYGQTSELWASMSMGSSMGICRGIPDILEDLQMVQPTLLFSVPTLYKKVYDGVHNIIQTASPLRRRLMLSALKLGDANARAVNGNGNPLGPINSMKYSILDKVVLSKIRDRFGGNLRCGFLGGSACPPEVLSFMDALGIPICEGYGLTETSPIITVNVPGQRSIGTVGRPIGGVEVYIVDAEGRAVADGEEGEVCCTGPNVMKGYYKNKEATDEVISVAPDGVSRIMNEDGFLMITGRIKEQYKLENGKYVVPTPIESAIGMSRFVSQVVLFGANRPYNIALLVPEWPAIRAELEIDDSVSEEELASDENVCNLMDGEMNKTCATLKKFEVPKKWAFVGAFTAANNMLTPKMSIRRHKVVEAYEETITRLYGESSDATSEAA